jgi:signal transduction histidine kinase
MRTTDDWPTPPLWLRARRAPEWVVATVIVATVVVGVVTYTKSLSGAPLFHAGLALTASGLGAAAAGLSLRVRTRWCRWPSLALVAAAPLVAGAMGVDPIIEWNLAIFTGCLLAIDGARLWVTAGVAAVANFAAVRGYGSTGVVTLTASSNTIALAAAVSAVGFVALGSSVRTQRRYWRQVELRSHELVAARDETVAHGIAQERLRIARDLHDLIGHQLAALNLRLGAAQVHLADNPGLASEDLDAARGNIQTVLAETQRILTVLRTPSDAPDGAVPGYDQIPTLVAASRAAGLDVEADYPTRPPALSDEASRAAYRIVREALTNATKHGTGTVSLTLRDDAGSLAIQTVNVARSDAESDRGYGLVGMRERAASVGGAVETRREGTLFWLTATLPLTQEAS